MKCDILPDPTHAPTRATVPPMLVTKAEAARALSVCVKTLDNLTKRGELRPVRIGSAVRYSPDDLSAFIARSRDATVA